MEITCKINGKIYTDTINPSEFLIDFLRRNGLVSVKRGCETSNCGLCSVLINGKVSLSCSVLAASVVDKEILTLEGLGEESLRIGMLMAAEGTEQCGYCSPGLIMSVISMKNNLKDPSEEDIKQYLAGNLCRCSGYEGQMRSIKNYLKDGKNE